MRLKRFDPGLYPAAGGNNGKAQLREQVQLAERRLVRAGQIGFIDPDQRFDAEDQGGGQVAVDQVTAWCRLRGNDDEGTIQVGCDWAKAAARIATSEKIAPPDDADQ